MELAVVDVIVFMVFLIAVIAVGVLMSRHEKDSEGYFLAGRSLSWWLIGFSLIAANISAEQFVGMSGQAAKDSIGLAVASYEWIAAVTLVVVAFFFLPKFLRSGIYTIPQYLEYRYNHAARTIMSLLMVIIYVGVTIATVVFLGAKAVEPLFKDVEVFGIAVNITSLSWVIGIAAAIYVAAGGLKACAWADLIQGSALIVGGAVIMVLSFMALDNPANFEGIDAAAMHQSIGVEQDATFADKFGALRETKMHMALPRTNTFLPWTALLLGIWIPNFYYWGLNQYIMQRTLGAISLAHGQKGIVFAAWLKLIIPFIVCVPGIIAFSLYGQKMQENAMTDAKLNAPALAQFERLKADPAAANKAFAFDGDFAQLYPEMAEEMLAFNAAVAGVEIPEGAKLADLNDKLIKGIAADQGVSVQQTLIGYDYDGAFPLLIRYLTPPGLRGFVLAALMGAVISSLASMLNAASTIFTMDIYREYVNKNASQGNLVWVGRACVLVFVLIGCAIAPQLSNPKFQGAFAYIQEFQGYISPGVLTIFLFGLFVPRSPRICGVLGLVLSPVIYGALHLFYSDMAFLNRMAITVGALAVVLAVATMIAPLKEAIKLPTQAEFDMRTSRSAKVFGLLVVLATAALYIIFW